MNDLIVDERERYYTQALEDIHKSFCIYLDRKTVSLKTVHRDICTNLNALFISQLHQEEEEKEEKTAPDADADFDAGYNMGSGDAYLRALGDVYKGFQTILKEKTGWRRNELEYAFSNLCSNLRKLKVGDINRGGETQ